MQNLGQFYTTPEFDRQYLRNESRNPKSEKNVIENDSSRVRRKKSGELWSANGKVGHVRLDPPKSTFSGDYISARYKDSRRLASTPQTWTQRFKFKGEHLKFGLKFSVYGVWLITLGLV